MKVLWMLALLVGFCGLAFADSTTKDAEKFKDSSVTEAISADIVAEAKARTEYNKAVIAAKTTLLGVLTTAQVKATKSGDLDEAVKLRDKISAVEAEIENLKLGGEINGCRIVAAQWGTELKNVDVTKKLQDMVKNGRLEVAATRELLGDPAPNQLKELVIRYDLNGTRKTERLREGGKVDIGRRY